MKPIKQSVLNTFARVGIDQSLDNTIKSETVQNRFGFGSCVTTKLVARCIEWVYTTSNQYEIGIQKYRLDDFDRVRHFILSVDANAYIVCID